MIGNDKKKHIQYKIIINYFWKHAKRYPGMLIIVILSTILSNIVNVISPIYLKKIVDIISNQPSNELFYLALSTLGVYIGFRILNAILNRSLHFTHDHLDANVMKDLNKFSFKRLMSHSHSFFLNSFTGALTQKINKFSHAYMNIGSIVVNDIIPIILWSSGAIYIVYQYSHRVAIVLILGILIFFVFNRIFIRYKSKFDRASSEFTTKINAYLSDTVSNHFTIQLFGGMKYEENELDKLLIEHKRKKLQQWNRGEVMYGTQSIVFVIVEYFILKYSLNGWIDGSITTGTIILFQVYIIGLVQRLNNFSNVFRQLSESFSDANEMVEILEKPLEITDSKNAIDADIQNGLIEFDNVLFEYKDGAKILDNFNLTIKHGEKIALVGMSGAGKSTLFKLLLRLYDPNNGSIKIDNYKISEITQDSLRQSIAYVPQETILFHRTLRENIKYGNMDATEEQVVEATVKSESFEFIDKTIHKFDTLVGERGVKLSGGERQRIAIARAILKNAPILLLDEATSSLDSYSEMKIQNALDNLMKNRTVIAIAHRLSTIKKMDRIIYIENGMIKEEGSHDELLQRENSAYKKLWNLQVDGFIQ